MKDVQIILYHHLVQCNPSDPSAWCMRKSCMPKKKAGRFNDSCRTPARLTAYFKQLWSVAEGNQLSSFNTKNSTATVYCYKKKQHFSHSHDSRFRACRKAGREMSTTSRSLCGHHVLVPCEEGLWSNSAFMVLHFEGFQGSIRYMMTILRARELKDIVIVQIPTSLDDTWYIV